MESCPTTTRDRGKVERPGCRPTSSYPPQKTLFQPLFNSWDDLVEFVDDGVLVWLAVLSEKLDQRFPEANSAFVHAVKDDDGLALHEVVTLLMEDHEREEFLHRAGTAGEDDEGVGVFDHDFHAGVDVVTKPEAGESCGKAFEFNDVRNIRSCGPTFGLDGSADDGAHDSGFSCAGDTTEFVVSEFASERFAIADVVVLFDGGRAEDADVADEIIGGGSVGVGGHGLLFGQGFAVDGGEAFVAEVGEGFCRSFSSVGDEEVVAVILFDGAELVEVVEELEDDVPRLVVVDDDGGLGGEVFVEGLVTDKDRNRFEEVLQAGAGGEDEGVGVDDFFFDISEGDLLVAVRVFDVPTSFEEVKEELGAGGTVGVFGTQDSSGKANGRHNFLFFKKGCVRAQSALVV